MCRKIMNRFALLLLLTAAVALMTAGCGKKTDPAGTGQPTGEETVPSGAENESTEDPRIMPELQSEDDEGNLALMTPAKDIKSGSEVC